MVKNWKYSLVVSYPLDKYEWGSLDEKIRAIAPENEAGGGTGFGFRDVDFVFETELEVRRAAEKASTVEPDLQVEWHEMEDGD